MSVAYKLQSNDIEVFYEKTSSSFLISKTVCSACESLWAHRINQCIFCGTRNYFIWICKECKNHVSLTSSSTETCSECGAKNSYLKSCFNDNCISNKDEELVNIIKDIENSKLGSFDKASPFKISQNFCIECANETNVIKSKELIVKDIELEKEFSFSDYSKLILDYDYVIVYSLDTSKFFLFSKENNEVNFLDDINVDIFFRIN